MDTPLALCAVVTNARSRRTVFALLVLSAIAIGQLGEPQATYAADGQTISASTTYTLNPPAGRLDVAIDVTVHNSTPSTTTYVSCIQWYWDPYWGYQPYNTTCPETTRYYISETYLWLENGATALRVTADHGTPKISLYKRGSGYDQYRVAFTKIFNGQTRKLHVSYQIKGGAPRSGSITRVSKAFASFCVSANGIDSGTAQVVIPSSYGMEFSAHNGSLTSTTKGSNTIYQTGALASPLDFWACFNGDDPAGYTVTTLTSPSGRKIGLEAWPEDPTWNADLKEQIGTALGQLEQLLGRPLPGEGPITVREVTSGDLGAYAGTFDPKTLVARVGEDLNQPGVVAHELSHAWFNDSLFDARWLSEGSADWAESTITGVGCPDPGTSAGAATKLADWQFAGPKATQQQLDTVSYEYAASCYVVSSVASRIGASRMRDALAALLDHKIAYQSGGLVLQGHTGAEDWRDWLDAIDELGLVPAGGTDLDYAQSLLARYGAIPDASALPARSQARATYHQLVGSVGNWIVPEAILRPMGAWQFADAMSAMSSESNAYAAVTAAGVALPESDALKGTVKQLVESAKTQADLNAAARAASDEQAAAEAMAAAKSNFETPRDFLSQVGLIGVDLRPALSAGLAAVSAIDLSAARSNADLINTSLNGASRDGLIRLGVAIGIVLLVVLVFWLLRRRRRATGRALALANVMSGPPTPEVTIERGEQRLLSGAWTHEPLEPGGASSIGSPNATFASEPEGYIDHADFSSAAEALGTDEQELG